MIIDNDLRIKVQQKKSFKSLKLSLPDSLFVQSSRMACAVIWLSLFVVNFLTVLTIGNKGRFIIVRISQK